MIETEAAQKPLIIGYGNPLRGDDAAGFLLAELLADRLGMQAEVIACHQLNPELADPISRASQVIFIDASVGIPAGSFTTEIVEPGNHAQTGMSHDFSPARLLNLSHSLFHRAPSATLVEIGASCFEVGMRPSNEVADAMGKVVAWVMNIIQTREVPCA